MTINVAVVIGSDPMMFDADLRSEREVYIVDEIEVVKMWTK